MIVRHGRHWLQSHSAGYVRASITPSIRPQSISVGFPFLVRESARAARCIGRYMYRGLRCSSCVDRAQGVWRNPTTAGELSLISKGSEQSRRWTQR